MCLDAVCEHSSHEAYVCVQPSSLPPSVPAHPHSSHPPVFLDRPVVYNDGHGGAVGPEEFAVYKTVEDLFVILADAHLNNLARIEVSG